MKPLDMLGDDLVLKCNLEDPVVGFSNDVMYIRYLLLSFG